MKSYKIIGEIVLAIFLLLIGYFLYKIGMNIRHDVPIIKGLISEDKSDISKDCENADTLYNKDCQLKQVNKDIYSVATFTEKIRNLQTTITYPTGRDDILASIKSDYEKFKLENQEEINATNTPNVTSGLQDTHFSYEVNYIDLGTSTKSSDFKSYIFTYYKYVAGAAHGESGMRSYNYLRDEKLDSLHGMYLSLLDTKFFLKNMNEKERIESKKEFYKKLHDEAKVQVVKSLKEAMSENGDTVEGQANIDMKWIEEGLSYSATNTINYDTWWIKGNDLYIYIAPYQVGPYAYGDREVVINIDKIK